MSLVRSLWEQTEDALERKWTSYFCPSSQIPSWCHGRHYNAHTRYANDPNSHPGSRMLAVIATAFHQPPAAFSHFVGQEADRRVYVCVWRGVNPILSFLQNLNRKPKGLPRLHCTLNTVSAQCLYRSHRGTNGQSRMNFSTAELNTHKQEVKLGQKFTFTGHSVTSWSGFNIVIELYILCYLQVSRCTVASVIW